MCWVPLRKRQNIAVSILLRQHEGQRWSHPEHRTLLLVHRHMLGIPQTLIAPVMVLIGGGNLL